MTDGIDANTTFLNVDLELRSNRGLQPVIDALGRRIVVLHSETVNGTSWIRVELARQRLANNSSGGGDVKIPLTPRKLV